MQEKQHGDRNESMQQKNWLTGERLCKKVAIDYKRFVKSARKQKRMYEKKEHVG